MSGTIHNPIRGLYTKQAFAKSLHKGEDAWLQQPKLSWSYASDSEGSGVKYDVFGVFDGHGGKQAANFAAKHMLPILQEELADISLKPGTALPEALEGYSQVSDEDKLAWQTQDAMVERLPAALVSTFKKVQDQFHEHAKISGTTATVAVIVGWDLLVASVGDSEAYLDTGAEVVQVCDTHRLDDNKAERKRCEDAGYEVCRSTVDGKPVGPERVWPGGLAMSRTIGDHMAGEVVLPEPAVRRVALPNKGARLIIASDGLWDAMNPRTAVHHVRGMQAGKAAGELVQAALKAKGLRDDITVLVIDAMPDDSFRLPPYLAKPSGGHAITVEDIGCVDWHKPLDEASASDTCARKIWQRRITAVQAEYGLVGSASSGHSSDTNADGLHSACSESAVDSAAFDTPFTSPQPLLEEDSSEWETVPVKPKREATAALSTSPVGWDEPESGDKQAGQWEIPRKQTKLNDQNVENASGIKAMHDGAGETGNANCDDSSRQSVEVKQQRSNRGRGRGRLQNRGRGRGRNDGSNSRRRFDQSQRNQSHQEQQVDHLAAEEAGTGQQQQQQNNPDGDMAASSWGAETVFPLTQSPLMPSPLGNTETSGNLSKVLTVHRPPQTRSMGRVDQQQQQHQQQRARGNRDDRRGNTRNGRGGRGRQNGQPPYVHSGPVYYTSEQPASQNISFGSFGADDFGSTFDASKSNAAATASEAGASNAPLYQDQNQQVQNQHLPRAAFRGRGRGRSHARGRPGNFGNNRQENCKDAPVVGS